MKEKRKICIIVPAHWEALMGGSQYQAKILIENLLPLDRFEIYYLARLVNSTFKPEGYEIIKISEPRWYHRYGYFLDSLTLLRILKDIRPDVIYQQVGCAYTGVAAYYARHSGCKMVWRVTSDKSVQRINKFSVREYFPDRYIERKFLEYGIRNAKTIIVQTESQADLLQKNHHINSVELVRNFHPKAVETIKKEKPYKVLWVANFKRLKQPELFIRLAMDLADIKTARFIMIGAPAGGQWQRDLQAQIALAKNLSYLGVQPQQRVNQLLAESHMLVNTSLYEGFPNTFIQAWMRKVPVVSLNVNPDDLLSDGNLGFCAGGSYQTLKMQITNLLSNSKLIDNIGSYAQAFANDHYAEKNIRYLIDVLECQ